jgi:hypothetical protein
MRDVPPSSVRSVGVPVQEVYELVLLGMSVPERGDSTRRQAGEIDAEVLEAKQIPEYALLTARDSRRERLWVDGLRWARGHLCRHGGGWKGLFGHDVLHC